MESNTTPTPAYGQSPQNPFQPSPASKPAGVSRGIFLAVAIVSACALLGLIVSLGFTAVVAYRSSITARDLKAQTAKNADLLEQVKALSSRLEKVEGLTGQMSTLSGKVDTLSGQMDSLSGEVSSDAGRVQSVQDQETQNWIAQDMNGAGVTDNFITSYVLFCANDTVYFDIYTQPSYSDNYTGKGKFSVSNGKLTSDVTEIINCLKTTYDKSKSATMPDFSALKIYVTIKNYDIGLYENGALTLTN